MNLAKLAARRVRTLLPPSLSPYVQSGLISRAFVSPDLKLSGELECLCLSELTGESFRGDNAALFISSLEELNFIEQIRGSTSTKIPYLHLESKFPADDLTYISSRLSATSMHYSYHDVSTGYRKAGTSYAYDVSVVIPVYNVAAFVGRCTKSLMTQDYKGRYELLFIDDGGPDNSVEIIKEIIGDWPHAQVLSKTNGGCADARNFGINAARGEYIALVDGDDYVAHNFLSSMMRAAVVNQAEVVQAGFAYVDANTNVATPHVEWIDVHTDLGVVAEPAYPLMLQTPGIWRRLYSSAFLRRNNISFNADFRRHDDLPFNIEVLIKALRVAVVRDVVYFYILGRDGQDVGATDERLFIHFRLFSYLVDNVANRFHNRTIYRAFLKAFVGHHLWAYDRIDANLKIQYLCGLIAQTASLPGHISLYSRLRMIKRAMRGRVEKFYVALFLVFLLGRKRLPSDLCK